MPLPCRYFSMKRIKDIAVRIGHTDMFFFPHFYHSWRLFGDMTQYKFWEIIILQLVWSGLQRLPCWCRELQPRVPRSHGFEPLEASVMMLCLIYAIDHLRERQPRKADWKPVPISACRKFTVTSGSFFVRVIVNGNTIST
jgi:hypothetical protein